MDSETTGLSVVCIWIVTCCIRYTVSGNFTNSLSRMMGVTVMFLTCTE